MRWFARRRPVQARPELAPTLAAPAGEGSGTKVVHVAEAERWLRDVLRRRDAAHRRLQQVRSSLATASEEAELAEADRDAVGVLGESFDDWIRGKHEAWGMLLLADMRRERDALLGDWNGLRERLDEPHPVRPRDLRELHTRFVRRVLWCTVIALVAVILLSVLLPTLHGDDWFEPWLVAALTVAERSAIVAVAIWGVVVFAALAAYHRGVSRRRMMLRVHEDEVRRAAEEVPRIRAERTRIEGLHKNVPEFLEMLSEVTHRPWLVPSASGHVHALNGEEPGDQDPSEKGSDNWPALSRVPRPSTGRLPAHIRLAEPVLHGNDTRAAARVREAVWLHLRRGWRSEAFSRLLQTAEASLSLPPGSLDVRVLDGNPRQRRVVLDALRARSHDGAADGERVQERLGAEMVRRLAEAYRAALLDAARNGRNHSFPPVREITSDPLAGLDVRDDLFARPNAESELDWNAYLGEVLKGQPELSLYELTGDAIAGIHHGRVPDSLRACIVGPERLSPGLEDGVRTVRYEPLTSSGCLPVEVAVRLDQRTLGEASSFALFEPSPPQPTIDLTTGSVLEVDVPEHSTADKNVNY